MHQLKTTLLLVLILSSVTALAKSDRVPLAAALIHDSLKKNAHAVIRYDSTTLRVKDLGRLYHQRKYAITILDEYGKNSAMVLEHYNLLTKINKIKGRLLDAEGKEIKSMKEKDIFDQSTFGLSYTFHSDSRIKSYSFNHSIYPYTVEFEIEKTINTTFFLPDWDPQPANDCAVAHSVFTLSFPQELNIRHKEYLMPEGSNTSYTDEEGNTVTTWVLSNIPAFKEQPLSNTGNYQSPTVVLAPSEFQIMEHRGNMQSWNSLGLFNYKLNEGRDSLPEDKKALIKSLLANETDTYQKVQKLYSYMQQHTHYVANEYGIAGWQTFDAASVAKNGYGDCKGLTNYLKAMLKEAGINAYTALVFAGKDDFHKLDEQFPSNTFNHVILCVPQEKDSIWVECTSQQLPAGYLGRFTQDRQVLLTTESGGYLCKTPAYGKDKSYITRKASLTFEEEARQQKITLQCIYSGTMQDDLEAMLKTQPRHKIQEMVNSKFPFPSYSVSSFNYKHTGTKMLPATEESVEAIVSGITSSTQKRTFINMAWMSNPMPEIAQVETRSAPFVLYQSFKITDTVTVLLPEGMLIESLPKETQIVHPFASYQCRFEKTANKIAMITVYEQNGGIYAPADFNKYQSMYKTIAAVKDMNIVLLNKSL
jgi:hypothetical protein